MTAIMDGRQDQEFLVIGAGLPRTGTLSFMYALEMILPGKCHHMMKALNQDKEWSDILSGKMNDEEFKNFFLSNNEVAAVDAPFCFEYQRAMRVFPNAKVILTVREPEGWIKSVRSTIFKRPWLDPSVLFMLLGLFPTYLGDPRHSQNKWPKLMFAAAAKHKSKMMELQKAVSEDRGAEFFNEWSKHVEAEVPKDRLLKFHVKEGWGPLCKFLGVPEPDVPFPRVNSTNEFADAHATIYRRSWLLLYEMITIPLCIYGMCKLLRN